MASYGKKAAKAPSMPKGNDEGGRFVDRNLMKMNPKNDKDQLAPTPSEPVSQHKRMAGAC